MLDFISGKRCQTVSHLPGVRSTSSLIQPTLKVSSVTMCASHCISSFPSCQTFNYNFEHGLCELMSDTDGAFESNTGWSFYKIECEHWLWVLYRVCFYRFMFRRLKNVISYIWLGRNVGATFFSTSATNKDVRKTFIGAQSRVSAQRSLTPCRVE